ncbi:CvpA family protein [Catenovulum sediminis]|uniref:CvpA family protein n=1 Tax=Catenovulum sediminis TaxID=1740262 RepID=A0ABV1RI46_9ALTE|nr:CvpA family protein [Catenovulum sediminis]
MVWFDYAILAVILISTLVSLVRGFVREALSLVVWLSAFFVASNFYLDFATFLPNIEDEMLRNAASIGILFIATIILGAIINYLISQLVQKTGLSGTDRVLGLVFGALRGVLIVSAVLFFMDAFTPAAKADWWMQSILIPEFKIVVEWFFEYIKTTSSFLKDVQPV